MAKGDDGSGKKQQSVGFKLFGVEINVADELSDKSLNVQKKRSHEDDGVGDDDDRLRKSKSMGNLHEMFNQSGAGADGGANGGVDESGYHSDGVLHVNSRRAAHMRRKGTPWTASEHRSFLRGLTKLGKGDWKGISKNYVPTRTPTQVASHAQKYFIRMTTAEKKNRRASLFDIPFNESNLPSYTPAAPVNASEGSHQVSDAAVAPLKRASEIRGLEWSSAHTAAFEKKPPLSPMSRNFAQDTGHMAYMAGVPGQSFHAAPVMPQAELYPVMNHTVSQYPNYYYVPSSHGNFPVPFMNQKSNGVFLQQYPPLYVTSEARPPTPAGGSFATSAPLPNYYQPVTGPPTNFAACPSYPNQYRAASGPATSFSACAPFPNHCPAANGPATSNVGKKDGLEAGIGTMSL
ncbi:putative transcription factor [Heracleum sosnowskyi]|uniref:Transcription factor n=1 Tax=Heracleum sosnowskyi TaxID=360622 RepID=A0AAD8IX65_9APIA|nr:putative transcription factor [Heracleum sosnowskyi]